MVAVCHLPCGRAVEEVVVGGGGLFEGLHSDVDHLVVETPLRRGHPHLHPDALRPLTLDHREQTRHVVTRQPTAHTHFSRPAAAGGALLRWAGRGLTADAIRQRGVAGRLRLHVGISSCLCRLGGGVGWRVGVRVRGGAGLLLLLLVSTAAALPLRHLRHVRVLGDLRRAVALCVAGRFPGLDQGAQHLAQRRGRHQLDAHLLTHTPQHPESPRSRPQHTALGPGLREGVAEVLLAPLPDEPPHAVHRHLLQGVGEARLQLRRLVE
mmetsp:Transcript_23713/g.68187  ORF Transcript_23713/g.68187 Transcript_23713/m.68187 type:complete len:266 (+) Transcript_23713:801-1598(+)